MYVEDLPLLSQEVGYGALGRHGNLGYEGKRVSVLGRFYAHALSAHPPSRLVFALDDRSGVFRCQVALNGDVQARASRADFRVLVDDRVVAMAQNILAGEPPRVLEVELPAGKRLELVVDAGSWPNCHAVWLDPQVTGEGEGVPSEGPSERTLIDPLERAEILLPATPLHAERCIATVVSPGYAPLLDDMLGSLNAQGGCPDALVLVFAVDADEECLRVIAKYGATALPCRSLRPVNATVKSVLYAVAQVVEARHYLCLDADMLVLGDLRPLFAALDACPQGSILVCRDAYLGSGDLEHQLTGFYLGRREDMARLLGTVQEEGAYPLAVNDGLFAGSREALTALEATLRAMQPYSLEWLDERADHTARNQFLFNLALARLRCGVELEPTYNLQVHVWDVKMGQTGGRMWALWRGSEVRVLHFVGWGRGKYLQWRGRFARVPDPLPGAGDGDGYAAFLMALRAWVGRYGAGALAWSFYGTPDGRSAAVRDPGVFPLLALLHYLVRANGCVRVLEAGTGRGVSTACLASAVAHRTGGRVVTFDLALHPQRADLWAALPEAMQAGIEPRLMGSLEGMADALDSGERYEAALLDSNHAGEHVWAEFQLASQLVCPGGLILVHDVCNVQDTVEQGLQRIESAGYGVVRLWTAEAGVPEDSHLGLAVIENRKRRVEAAPKLSTRR